MEAETNGKTQLLMQLCYDNQNLAIIQGQPMWGIGVIKDRFIIEIIL
jgi:hypothetical protein